MELSTILIIAFYLTLAFAGAEWKISINIYENEIQNNGARWSVCRSYASLEQSH